MPDDHFLVLALVGQCERDANRVADTLREQLLESYPRLDNPVWRQSRLGHAEMDRYVGPALREAPIRVHHLVGIGILQRDDEAREAETVHQIAMVRSRLDDRGELIAGVLVEERRRD